MIDFLEMIIEPLKILLRGNLESMVHTPNRDGLLRIRKTFIWAKNTYLVNSGDITEMITLIDLTLNANEKDRNKCWQKFLLKFTKKGSKLFLILKVAFIIHRLLED